MHNVLNGKYAFRISEFTKNKCTCISEDHVILFVKWCFRHFYEKKISKICDVSIIFKFVYLFLLVYLDLYMLVWFCMIAALFVQLCLNWWRGTKVTET
jgi:hypothetical protein